MLAQLVLFCMSLIWEWYLDMVVHDAAAAKVRVEKVHDAELGRRSDVHQCLFILDLGICAMLRVAHMLCAGEFCVELLETLLAEGVEPPFVLLELGDQGIFVVFIVWPVDEGGDLGVEGGHDFCWGLGWRRMGSDARDAAEGSKARSGTIKATGSARDMSIRAAARDGIGTRNATWKMHSVLATYMCRLWYNC